MPVNDVALLILEEERSGSTITRLVEVEAGTYVLPLRWLISKKLKSACMLDKTFLMTSIEEVSVKGIPRPRTLGAPIITYVLLLVFGWLTLSTPILVRFKMSTPRRKTIDEAKQIVTGALSSSIHNSLDLARVQDGVRHARSVRDLALVVVRARE